MIMILKTFGSSNIGNGSDARTAFLDLKITELEPSATISWRKKWKPLNLNHHLRIVVINFQYLKTTCCSIQGYYSEHLEANIK